MVVCCLDQEVYDIEFNLRSQKNGHTLVVHDHGVRLWTFVSSVTSRWLPFIVYLAPQNTVWNFSHKYIH